MNTSGAINGDLGAKIGNKVVRYKEDIFLVSGIIELWHDGDMVVAEKFKGKTHRRDIIKKWQDRYQFQNKHGVFFQIRYL